MESLQGVAQTSAEAELELARRSPRNRGQQFQPRCDAEFSEQVSHVKPNRAQTDAHRSGNFFVALAERD